MEREHARAFAPGPDCRMPAREQISKLPRTTTRLFLHKNSCVNKSLEPSRLNLVNWCKHNLSMCPDQESNQQPLALWHDAQPTEPHWPGQWTDVKVLWEVNSSCSGASVLRDQDSGFVGGMGWKWDVEIPVLILFFRRVETFSKYLHLYLSLCGLFLVKPWHVGARVLTLPSSKSSEESMC